MTWNNEVPTWPRDPYDEDPAKEPVKLPKRPQ